MSDSHTYNIPSGVGIFCRSLFKTPHRRRNVKSLVVEEPSGSYSSGVMRRIVRLLGAVLVLGALASVLTRPPSAGRASFFPLALHNTWTHEVTFSGGDYHYYMTETVIRDDFPLPEGVAYVVAEEYEPLTDRAPKAKSTVAYLRKDGFLLRYPWLDSEHDTVWDTQLGEGFERVLPSPYTREQRWSAGLQTHAWPLEGGQDVTASAQARIDPDAVRVSAGTFRHCLRVETRTTSRVADPRRKTTEFHLHHTEWYARGVGLVKAISSEGAGTPVKSVTELVSYRVSPPSD